MSQSAGDQRLPTNDQREPQAENMTSEAVASVNNSSSVTMCCEKTRCGTSCTTKSHKHDNRNHPVARPAVASEKVDPRFSSVPAAEPGTELCLQVERSSEAVTQTLLVSDFSERGEPILRKRYSYHFAPPGGACFLQCGGVLDGNHSRKLLQLDCWVHDTIWIEAGVEEPKKRN